MPPFQNRPDEAEPPEPILIPLGDFETDAASTEDRPEGVCRDGGSKAHQPRDSGWLTSEQQQDYLDLISRGASPSAACREVNVSIRALNRTLSESPAFRADYDEVAMLLNQNVETALYHAAMKGNVSAQTLWLRKRPPPGWPLDDDRRNPQDPIEQLSDAELLELARAQGLAIPPELESPPAS